MRFFICFLILALTFSATLLFAKGPPPGTGVGDVKANIMIMLDNSGSMLRTDRVSGLDVNTVDLAVANNGDIFALDKDKDRVSRLDSSYAVKGQIGGFNSRNNDASRNAKFNTPYGLALDQSDPADEFFYVANRNQQNGLNGFAQSYISKVCTGITITGVCPEMGRLVAVDDPGMNMSGIAVQGNYLYAMGTDKILFKYNKLNLVEVTRRNINSKIQNFDASRSDIAAVGAYVLVSNYHNREFCRFNASDLSDATFAASGDNCKNLGFRPRAMTVAGKTTASTSDDEIYIWRNSSSATIKKYSVDTGVELVITNIARGSGPGQTRNSIAIDVDSSGNLYAAEVGSSHRLYVSKFNNSLTYVDRGPGGGPPQNRMQIAHAAIRAILQDPDLISGANFGLFGWGISWSQVLRTPISSAGANDILTRSLALVTARAWSTQLGRALQWMRTDYWHKTGTTPIDPGAPCQGNFNLIISDGRYFGSTTPETQMPLLTNHPTMPVRSFIVGLGNDISGSSSFINLAQQQYGDTTPPGALFANNVQALTLQLRSAILAAINTNLTFTSPKVDFSSTPNGYICQPSFKYKQEDQWQGLLTRYEVKPDGSIDDPQGLNPLKTIRFHDKLDGRSASVIDPNGRKIWTVDHDIENPTSGIYQNNNFDPDYITPSNVNMLEASTKGLMLDGGVHLAERDVARIMKFMRGHDMFDQDTDCSAGTDPINISDPCFIEDRGGADAPSLYKLNDFYNSTPVYLGKPIASASSDVAGTENEYRHLNNYNAFKTLHQNRKNVLLIGSNGGMLHAFDNGCNTINASCPTASDPGRELWAFVPPPIVKNFQNIVSPQPYTKLTANVTGSHNAINVANTATFPSNGILRINEEYMKYTGKTGTEFTGLTRGYDCTGNSPFCSDASAHLNDTVVYDETALRKPKYSVFGADGPVVAKDIYTNGTWKTIAMAGFGKGGRGYTALDVTNPDYPIHMFTVFNDIRGPGLNRSVKIWQTTENSLIPNTYETVLNEYNYSMATISTSVLSPVNAAETLRLPVNDASSLRSTGYITVSNPDGTEEIIHYASKSGNDLQTLTRGEDANGSSTAMPLEVGAVVAQDSHCSLSTTNVPAEYDYTRLALTTSMPHIINIKVLGTKKWVAVFGGGQNYGMDCTTGDVVYVMDLEDDPGTIIKQIAIPDDPANSIYNSVNTNLTVIQRDGTAKANYYGALVYFADLENKLWKIDLTEKAGSNLGRKIKVFEDVATDTNGRRNYQELLPVLDSSQNVPITGSSTENNILRLYYGTGDMNNLAERNSLISNRLYGISDIEFTNFSLPWKTASDTNNNLPLSRYEISDCNNSTSLSATCPILSNVGSKNIGWYIDLPESRKTTGRKALYDKEQIYFVIYQPTNVLCNPGDAILSTYQYMCPNHSRLSIALGAGLGTGATTQGSQIYIGVSNAQINGIYERGDIIEQEGLTSGTASLIAQEIKNNTKGTDSIIVLSPVGTASTGLSTIDAWRHYTGENYFE